MDSDFKEDLRDFFKQIIPKTDNWFSDLSSIIYGGNIDLDKYDFTSAKVSLVTTVSKRAKV